ncbi:MAG: hypothetical protein PHY48_01025 [Candidatus Cloacimonetes bacterium]|nr:hypothetical protein [Candidatus Cloacimonadota bacterium]
MKPLLKVPLVIGSLIALFVLVGIIWLNQLALQLGFLVLVAMILAIQKGIRHLLKSILVLLPFLITLAVMYVLFALIGFNPTPTKISAASYWFAYGSVRMMVLLNMVLMFEIGFHVLKWKDVLQLPLGINKLKYLLLGRILFRSAFSSQTKLETYLDYVPSNQLKLSYWNRVVRLRLTNLLAIIYIVIMESELKGELIDNRIKHCHRRNDEVV